MSGMPWRQRAEPPEVTITSGRLRGAWKDSAEVAVFAGVPFAAPPVGDRRWRPPQAVESWTGVRAATKESPTAYQRAAGMDAFITMLVNGQGWSRARATMTKTLFDKAPRPKESEDCLYLTVRTPDLGADAQLPVMVWIHGGDHSDGSGSDPFYASTSLAKHGVVTVNINYRLGLFGYFAHPELSAEGGRGVSGNYGTLDQIAALEWVRDNISAFGGDPDNVTIFGESAGGESVLHMMTSPGARGLFHRAIPQSPANGGQMMHLRRPFLNYDAAEDRGLTFADALGITGTGQLDRLRSLAPDELMALVRAAPRLGDHYPVIDGEVLPESPLAAFAGGRQASVPLLIGSNADEGTLIKAALDSQSPMVEFRHQPVPGDGVQPEMAEAFGDDLEALTTLYPGLDHNAERAAVDFMGDHFFGARAYWCARHHAAAGNPTWLYLFTRVPPSPKQTAGAYHGAELPFVHGVNIPVLPLTADDKPLAAQIQAYWTSFAKTANPNGTASVSWPPFDPADPVWLELDHTIEPRTVDRVAQYEILNRRTERLVADMAELSNAAPIDLTEVRSTQR